MNLPTYDDALERVLDEIVRPDARSVDADGTFPRRGIDALGEAGILGLTVAEPFGGGGALADAVDVVRRLAEVCGSTAMVVLMHYAATSVIDLYAGEDVRKAIGSGSPSHDAGLLRSGVKEPLLGPAFDRHVDRWRRPPRRQEELGHGCWRGG